MTSSATASPRGARPDEVGARGARSAIKMLQLYLDLGCPFCVRVTEHLDDVEVPYVPKQMSPFADSETRRELIELGGKPQVPFLYDPERGVKMYESADIIRYVDEHYVAENGGA